jgi:hypothetical protein
VPGEVGAELADDLRVRDEVVRPDQERARRRGEQADHLLDQGRLPGAVRSEEPVGLARLDAERDPVVRTDAALVDLRDVVGTEGPVEGRGWLGRPPGAANIEIYRVWRRQVVPRPEWLARACCTERRVRATNSTIREIGVALRVAVLVAVFRANGGTLTPAGYDSGLHAAIRTGAAVVALGVVAGDPPAAALFAVGLSPARGSRARG